MDKTEAERILSALKSGTPLISRHKAAEALEWAMGARWISVEERMPDGKDSVIAWSTDHGGFAIEVEVFEGMWLIINDERVYNVTHWQPLPAGPGVRDAPDDGTIILDRWVSGTVMSAKGRRDE